MRYILLILIILLFSFGIGFAGEINSEILQTKMNRFYFASGEEADIFQNCYFVITKHDDTIFDGHIEASYSGVSYSYAIDNIADSINIDSCQVFIQPAKIDSLSPINIGILKSIPYGSASNFPGITSVTSNLDTTNNKLSKYGNNLHTYLYETDTEMLIDFESGLIDAFVSYKKEMLFQVDFKTISAPAPFYAALIPNISKAVNEKGFMTTSLYYRFNDKRISTIFPGDNIEPYYSLYYSEAIHNRLFEFDPANGRNLLKYLIKKPKRIQFAIDNSSLKNLGLYFADILSRDRIRTKFTKDISKADVHLKLVPLSEYRIGSSLIYIIELLKNDMIDSKNGNLTNITILEIDQYLELAANAFTAESQKYYLDLAQRSLIEDIGVFPLLRPSLFFTTNENLKGSAFDTDGNIDLSNLRKVVLPQIPNGEIK